MKSNKNWETVYFEMLLKDFGWASRLILRFFVKIAFSAAWFRTNLKDSLISQNFCKRIQDRDGLVTIFTEDSTFFRQVNAYLLKSWFHKIFWAWSNFNITFPHCEVVRVFCNELDFLCWFHKKFHKYNQCIFTKFSPKPSQNYLKIQSKIGHLNSNGTETEKVFVQKKAHEK